MKKIQILNFSIIHVSVPIFKISSKSETWSPEPVRFGMEHTIYVLWETIPDKLCWSYWNLLLRNKEETSLHRIVTCDEKWILYDNRKPSASWLDEDEASKHSPKPNIHQKKLIVTAWWSSHGLIHYSFIK